MEIKRNMSERYHEFIRTEHVFIEADSLYFEKDSADHNLAIDGIVQWFPVGFQGRP